MKNSWAKREEYVYKNLSCSMATKNLSNVLYATIICHASITNTWTLAYEYERAQNSRNGAWFVIHIHPDYIEKFEKESGMLLTDPQKISLNSN